MTKYLEYMALKEFYTIREACDLLNMSKKKLKEKCTQYDIIPRRNEIGAWGLVKYDIRKLHNYLYYEDRKNKRDMDEAWK